MEMIQDCDCSGIYLITNSVNGKKYIGQAKSILNRIYEHRRGRNGVTCGKNYLLYRAFNKYGIDKFRIEILERCEIDLLNEREIYWVKAMDTLPPNGYNMREGGNCARGWNHSEESKLKMSLHRKEAYKGSENPFYGKTHSDEQKAKWRQQRGGRKLPDEWVENIRKGNRSEELKGRAVNQICSETDGIIATFPTAVKAAQSTGIHRCHIGECCRGQRKSAGGFIWRFAPS